MSARQGLCLLCEVERLLCALPLDHVSEIMRPLPLERVAGAPDFVLGVTPIRGGVTPVINCAALLGMASSRPGRFVTLRADDHQVALAVDTVVDVIRLPLSSRSDMPPLLRDTNPDVISSIEILEPALLLILLDAHLVPESVWASRDAAAE